jgi:serine phosphatase RsbU (regulator of sigma subunit)
MMDGTTRMSTTQPETVPDAYEMVCMEVLGGIKAARTAVKCPGLDLWLSSRPYRDETTGGDVHYVSLCGGGVITRILLGDVSGHGEHVRDYAEELRRLVKRHIVRHSQARFMKDLNRSFGAYAQLNRFATAVVMTYRSNNRSMEMCIAGHPRPLIFRKATGKWAFLGEGADREAATIGVSNLPIGVDETAGFQTFRMTLEPGDVLILYTDAMTEARSAENGFFGEQGLLKTAQSIDPANETAETIGARLLESVASHLGETPREDDETVMVLCHNGAGRKSAGLGERLEAMAKMFRLKDF